MFWHILAKMIFDVMINYCLPYDTKLMIVTVKCCDQVSSSSHVQYLLLDSGGQLMGTDHDPINDQVLGMPGKLGVAHQDHVS